MQQDTYIAIDYILKDEHGNVIDSTEGNQPFSFISGRNQILPELEKRIFEMKTGETKKIILSPENAYGNYDLNALQLVKLSQFPKDQQLNIGDEFIANTAEGRPLPFVVKEITGQDVTLDFNHPLAGKELTFELKLIEVRPASDEEIRSLAAEQN